MSFVGLVIEQFVQNQSWFIPLLLLIVFVAALSKFFSAPKPGPNPFLHDAVKPYKPLVTDQRARDKVLKQGFQSKLVPDNLDAIVIGSGIGGLSAAAILSKSGYKVLVLEQHDQAGGACHTFINKGFEFDVGIHYIGEMRNNTVTRLLVSQLTAGQLQWCDLAKDFDVAAIGEPGKQKFYPFHAGDHAVLRQILVEKFPGEEKAIDKYLNLLKTARKNTFGAVMVKALPKWIVHILISTGLINVATGFFKLARRTVNEVLDELTDNADLKAVLAYSWGDYGSPPSDGSFAMHAALINHYLYGASYPRGGASEIAFNIVPVIESAGGRVLVRAPVIEILTDSNGHVNGVKVSRSSENVDIYAPLVISDAGVVNTFTRLLRPSVAKRSSINSLIDVKVKSGVSAMSLFVGLNGTADELGIKPQNIWAYTSNDLSGIAEEFLARPPDEIASSDIPLLFISFPSSKDPTFNDRYPGKTVCTVVTIANWEWFKHWQENRVMKRGDDYESVKMSIGRRMWEQVLAIYPQLADKVEHFEVGSPATNNYYFSSPRGEIYGLDHSAKHHGNPEVMMHLRPDTEIPGLMLTGQDIVSCGFAGALLGGLLCASSVLHRNLYSDLVDLRKRIAKSN